MVSRRRVVVDAVTFDLDDTLFPQSAFLAGAWDEVARAVPDPIDRSALRAALTAVAAEGSDRGRIIDRALERIGCSGSVDVAGLVEVFRHHQPARLDAYPGAADAVARLRRRVPVGLITDGDVEVQEAKLRALGLADAFDVVVCSDRFGRAQRKPSPVPFGAALRALGARPARSVHVGDRPAKDVVGALRAGMAALRVRTGEYSAAPDLDRVQGSVPDVTAAVTVIEHWLDAGGRVGLGGEPVS